MQFAQMSPGQPLGLVNYQQGAAAAAGRLVKKLRKPGEKSPLVALGALQTETVCRKVEEVENFHPRIR
ncbi:MAG: hypothetical protein WCD46_13500, partial [Desulfobacterales bacterium]